MRKFKGLVSAVVLGASALVMTACGVQSQKMQL